MADRKKSATDRHQQPAQTGGADTEGPGQDPQAVGRSGRPVEIAELIAHYVRQLDAQAAAHRRELGQVAVLIAGLMGKYRNKTIPPQKWAELAARQPQTTLEDSEDGGRVVRLRFVDES